MKHTCPECRSPRVVADGDMVEDQPRSPDFTPGPAYFYGWWTCEECRHSWRYQEDKLNPGSMKSEHSASAETPLKCGIEGDELVIRIGLEVLKHSAEYCPSFYDNETCNDPPFRKIVDRNQLAKDVRREMFREEEDGSSPISNLLDAAIVAAHDDGSEAFEEIL